jgi:TonB family protein
MLVVFFATAGLAQEQIPASPAVGFDTDRVPRLTVVPTYPGKAKRDRVEGEVQVCFNIDRKGKTHRLTVRKSTHRIFEKPSLKAVRDSTYEPLPKDAIVPGIKSCRTFRFFLEPVVIDDLDNSD